MQQDEIEGDLSLQIGVVGVFLNEVPINQKVDSIYSTVCAMSDESRFELVV